MAKTLKEIAEDYAMYDGTYKSMLEAYMDGATDQRKIDIEKAWQVFEKYATYIHPRKGEETCIVTKYKFIEDVGRTMNLSGIKKIHFSDKPIAIAENCTISCDTVSEVSKDWSSIVPMSFTATIENPTYLLAFRLQYGVSDWLEWHDGLFKRFWYEYTPRPVWQSVEEDVVRYEEEYSKQMNNG